jgi:hypothetical protein
MTSGSGARDDAGEHGKSDAIAAIVDGTRAAFLDRLTSSVALAVPLEAPLVRIGLRGWVGLAEAASVAWVKQCVDAESPTYDGPPAPQAKEVRDLLGNALLGMLESIGRIEGGR